MLKIMEITLHRLSKENTNSREKFIFVRFTIVISSYVEYRFCWDEGKIFSHRTESLEFHHKLFSIDYQIHNKFVKSYFHIYFYHIFNHQSIPIYYIVKYCHRNMMVWIQHPCYIPPPKHDSLLIYRTTNFRKIKKEPALKPAYTRIDIETVSPSSLLDRWTTPRVDAYRKNRARPIGKRRGCRCVSSFLPAVVKSLLSNPLPSTL